MKRLVVTISLFMLCASQSFAATWYTFTRNYTDAALYFFDLDTIIKQGDTITIWVKYVNDQSSPDSDGSYSTAQKTLYTCSKRTMQVFTSVIYDKTGKFIRTFPEPSTVIDLVPGSVGEGILKTICAPDFPKNKSGDLYFAVDGNDIFKHTQLYFDFQRAKNNDPAPK